ncbi:flagellin N-terminal helical domain-containing protein [Laribacter hongkongensis]|uniref:flagellin N-terminal helical domain-containing protein n=1 Tax=Laribacter hongkongensis TaxID=168471 RepID=UPI001EFEC094|nr:flagellin [Laribacter hongkongensis]MCG9042290.1 flagellin FliC [Laribacter hongkongensis]MCG9056931.1 flagellin FliC [Laribacter hongkongensis]MCG9069041.1 flagellin FliC [Laribacter hongkongensis]
MALYVNTNVASLNAQRNLTTSTSSLSTSLQRLSSGLRVNSAKDDAAGLAIASGMTAQIRGGNQAIRNANDALSLTQTAEGVLSQMESNTQRMRELSVQAANATTSTANFSQIKLEIDSLAAENSRLISGSKFNGQALFSDAAIEFSFQVGAGTSGDNQIAVTMAAASFSQAAGSVTLVKASDALSAIKMLDNDLGVISNMRANLGAAQNRFSAVVSNLQSYVENLSASKGRIMDTDFAEETANMTRNQIIQQAGTAMLSQANQLPNAAMSLLR